MKYGTIKTHLVLIQYVSSLAEFQKASELENDFYIAIYNALAWKRREIVSVPMNIIANYAVQVQRNESWHHLRVHWFQITITLSYKKLLLIIS